MKIVLGLLLAAFSVFAQTTPAATQLHDSSKATACVLVFQLGFPSCAVLDPSVSVTTTGGVTTIKATAPTIIAPVPPNVIFGEVYIATANQAAFTLLHSPSTGTTRAFRNGIRQALGTDYSISGAVVTFLFPPGAGDIVLFDYNY